MTRADWVAACLTILRQELDVTESYVRALAESMADDEIQKTGSLNPKDWTTPVRAADEEVRVNWDEE